MAESRSDWIFGYCYKFVVVSHFCLLFQFLPSEVSVSVSHPNEEGEGDDDEGSKSKRKRKRRRRKKVKGEK